MTVVEIRYDGEPIAEVAVPGLVDNGFIGFDLNEDGTHTVHLVSPSPRRWHPSAT